MPFTFLNSSLGNQGDQLTLVLLLLRSIGIQLTSEFLRIKPRPSFIDYSRTNYPIAVHFRVRGWSFARFAADGQALINNSGNGHLANVPFQFAGIHLSIPCSSCAANLR